MSAALKKYNQLKAAGLKPCSYSGRFMYGKYCVGVRVERHAQGDKLLKGATFDSMGLGSIAYWPCLEWDDTTMQEAE
jgi:hypothetical protein